MLRITRGCKATETLPVTPEAITLGLAAERQTRAALNTTTATAALRQEADSLIRCLTR